MPHYKVVCGKCSKVIKQCRCISCSKLITTAVCDECKKKAEA